MARKYYIGLISAILLIILIILFYLLQISSPKAGSVKLTSDYRGASMTWNDKGKIDMFIEDRRIFTNGVFLSDSSEPQKVKSINIVLTDEPQELYTMVANNQPYSSLKYELKNENLTIYIYVEPKWAGDDKEKIEDTVNLRVAETLLYLTPQTDNARAIEYYKVRQQGREIDWELLIKTFVDTSQKAIKIS